MPPRALALVLVLFFPLASCGEQGASREPVPHRRVLVVGWDGADLLAIEPLLAAGRLPHLAALVARGTKAELASTAVPISSAAWPAATTGKGPGATGVLGFHAPSPDGDGVVLVSSRSVRAAPLWRLLTGRGLRSLVFGVPLTYPPEPLLGTMVCGMLAPTDADFAYPPGLADALRARGYVPDIEPWLEDRTVSWEEARRQLDVREEVLVELLAREDWSLAWVVLKELDVLSHFSYGLDFPECVAPVYERLDALLGALLAAAGEDVDVLVVSDHGFRTYARGLNLHAWLQREGFAARRADAAPVEEPAGPLAARLPAEAAQRLAELDLARTAALAATCEGNVGTVRLNLRGRERRGSVDPAEADALLDAIAARLREHPWIVDVARASELMPGPERDALPDLVATALDDVQLFAQVGTELQGVYAPEVPDHRRAGMFVAAGPSLRAGAAPLDLTLVDLAPLVLHLLELPVPGEMHGRVPLALLRGTRPVRHVPEAEYGAPAPPGDAAYTPDERRALERGLEALGYGND